MKEKQSLQITIQELRECPEFADLDDCVAQIFIDTIQDFCTIIANQYGKVNAEQDADEVY